MERIGNKVSYIRKPLAKYSFVSLGLTIAAYALGIVGLGMAYQTQGNAPMTAAALALCSVLVALSAMVYGGFSFAEKEKNYLLAKICLVAAGLLVFFWAVVIAVAL